MGDSPPYLLCLILRFTGSVLYLATAAALLTWTHTSAKNSSQEERPSGAGHSARNAFLTWVTIGALARGCSDALQIFACDGRSCVDAWECKLARGMANAPFLGAWVVFAGFLCSLRRAAAGLPCPRLLPLFHATAGCFGATLGFLSVRALTSPDAAKRDAYGRAALGLMAAAYFTLPAFLFHAYRSLVTTLEVDLTLPPVLKDVLRRLCLLLGGFGVVQAVRYAIWATPDRTLAGPCYGACVVDFLLNLVVEFCPCVGGFLLLRPRSARGASPTASSTPGGGSTPTMGSTPTKRLTPQERSRLRDARLATEARYSAV